MNSNQKSFFFFVVLAGVIFVGFIMIASFEESAVTESEVHETSCSGDLTSDAAATVRTSHNPELESRQPLPPVLSLSKDASVESALTQIEEALSRSERDKALVLARALRQGNEQVVEKVRCSVIAGGEVNPKCLDSRYRMTAACLASPTSVQSELLELALTGWVKESLSEECSSRWKAIEKKPLGEYAYKALPKSQLFTLNGMMQALLLRRDRGSNAEAQQLWKVIWLRLRAKEHLCDPHLSACLYHWKKAFPAEGGIPAGVREYFIEIRNDLDLSMRLRLQAANAIATVSENIVVLVVKIKDALGFSEIVELFGKFMAQAPELSKEDWSLLLAALKQRGNANQVLLHGLLMARKGIQRSGRFEVYGTTLVELYFDPNLKTELAKLAGGAFTALQPARTAVGHKISLTRRQRLIAPEKSESVLASILSYMRSGEFTDAEEDRPGYISRSIYIIFELSVSSHRKMTAALEILSLCKTKTEYYSATVTLTGSVNTLDDAEVLKSRDEFFRGVLKFVDARIVAEAMEGEPSKRTYPGTLLQLMRTIHKVANLQAYPVMSNDEFDTVTQVVRLFTKAVNQMPAPKNRTAKRQLQSLIDEFERMCIDMDEHYDTGFHVQLKEKEDD